MKGDVFHAYDPTSVRESTLGVRMSRPSLPTSDSFLSSSPQIGYKVPFSSDLIRYSTRLERRNDDISGKATHHGEGVELASFDIGHPKSSEAPSSTFCRACPQYGHALIFPRKCYYEAQCPLPLLFCANQHGEKAVRTLNTEPRISHQTLVHSFLRRLSSTISKKLAKNDPNKILTNFGWIDKPESPPYMIDPDFCHHDKVSLITGKCVACGVRPEVPYHLRHDRGSQ
jgi:hypothetical protein